ncbi:MAG TPA: EamA family transporter [Clostridiaceae bacterium]|nr:EamA family transporter [Clostridiaceae bacterium]
MSLKTLFSSLNKKIKGIILLIITSILWSFGGLLIKSVSTHPLAIAGIRSGIAAVLVLIIKGKPKLNRSLAQIGAALSYAATVLLIVLANKNTTAANVILIQYTSPIYVALLGRWLLKEKVKLLDWITIFIALSGMVLIFIGKVDVNGLLGNILAAGSGISFALLTIFMRMQKDGSPTDSVIMGNVLATIIGIPFIINDFPDMEEWVFLILMGIFQLGLPYILYSWAIKHVTALEASMISIIEPILNPVWVFLLLGEVPDKNTLVGGFIVIMAIVGRWIFDYIYNYNVSKYQYLLQHNSDWIDERNTTRI